MYLIPAQVWRLDEGKGGGLDLVRGRATVRVRARARARVRRRVRGRVRVRIRGKRSLPSGSGGRRREAFWRACTTRRVRVRG